MVYMVLKAFIWFIWLQNYDLIATAVYAKNGELENHTDTALQKNSKCCKSICQWLII